MTVGWIDFMTEEIDSSNNLTPLNREKIEQFHNACATKDIILVRQLLRSSNGRLATANNRRFMSPLQSLLHAQNSHHSDYAIAQILVESDPLVISGGGDSPLNMELGRGKYRRRDDIVRLLLETDPLFSGMNPPKAVNHLFGQYPDWNMRLFWVKCYCERMFQIPHATTEKYPLHSVMRCAPIIFGDRILPRSPESIRLRGILTHFRAHLRQVDEQGRLAFHLVFDLYDVIGSPIPILSEMLSLDRGLAIQRDPSTGKMPIEAFLDQQKRRTLLSLGSGKVELNVLYLTIRSDPDGLFRLQDSLNDETAERIRQGKSQ